MSRSKVTVRITVDSAGLWLAALVLLALTLTGSVARAREGTALTGSEAYAPLLQGGSGRHYYVTRDTYDGADADTACASGYHMASLWEILDVSNLVYDTSLGLTDADSGEGPPTGEFWGWVRTGYSSDVSNTPGKGNCEVWSSASDSDYGSCASLVFDWTSTPDLGTWWLYAGKCSTDRLVWCVED